jgi:nitrite reductase/ring-hydroxylating ferredoxin subunit/DMSO/TMAO reductase YedYZ heme-binding membrane subunit
MSVRYVAVQWTRTKVIYDTVLVVGIALFLQVFERMARATLHGDRALSPEVLDMRAWGACAFTMLSLILCIGPLARLDRRFAPLLYNRRHFGVAMSLVALGHAWHVLGFYYAYSSVRPLAALFENDDVFTTSSLPFPLLGAAALAIVVGMAATSHDFWQKLLGARAWKSLHMLVYLAYALVVLHVAFGVMQTETSPLLVGAFLGSVVVVVGLHLVASSRSAAQDRAPSTETQKDGKRWLDAGPVSAVPKHRPLPVIGPRGEKIAVVRHAGGLSAMHGVCAHQGGPLTEGRVIDGCLTCPWHGWQYRPEDGCAPPPFVEKLPTYELRVENGRLFVCAEPQPAGTKLPPVPIDESTAPETPEAGHA